MISSLYMLLRLIEQPLSLHLFGNDHLPADGDDAGKYQQVRYPGYAPQSIDQSGWEIIGLEAQHQDFAFLLSSGGQFASVYGYYVLDASGELVMSERLDDAPFTMVNLGDKVTIQPRVRIRP